MSRHFYLSVTISVYTDFFFLVIIINSCPFDSQDYPGLNDGVARISFPELVHLPHNSHEADC